MGFARNMWGQTHLAFDVIFVISGIMSGKLNWRLQLALRDCPNLINFRCIGGDDQKMVREKACIKKEDFSWTCETCKSYQ